MSLGESLMTLENHSGSHLQGSAVQEHCATEYGDTTNYTDYTLDGMVSHPRRLEPSATQPQEPLAEV